MNVPTPTAPLGAANIDQHVVPAPAKTAHLTPISPDWDAPAVIHHAAPHGTLTIVLALVILGCAVALIPALVQLRALTRPSRPVRATVPVRRTWQAGPFTAWIERDVDAFRPTPYPRHAA